MITNILVSVGLLALSAYGMSHTMDVKGMEPVTWILGLVGGAQLVFLLVIGIPWVFGEPGVYMGWFAFIAVMVWAFRGK